MHLSSVGSYTSLKDTFASLMTNLTAHNASIFAENAKVGAFDRMCAPGSACFARADVPLVCCVRLTHDVYFFNFFQLITYHEITRILTFTPLLACSWPVRTRWQTTSISTPTPSSVRRKPRPSPPPSRRPMPRASMTSTVLPSPPDRSLSLSLSLSMSMSMSLSLSWSLSWSVSNWLCPTQQPYVRR